MEPNIYDPQRRIIPPFLAPGAAYYVTGEDRFRVSVVNTLAGVVLSVRGRFVQLGGQVQPFQQDFTPASDGSTSTADVVLGEGWLMNVEVLVTSGTPTGTQTFCTLALWHGDSAAAFEIAVINQGYLTAATRLFWPWQQQLTSFTISRDTIPKIVTIANPAAGADFSQAVTAGKYWRILSIYGKLVTDGNAANRNAYVNLTDSGGAVLWQSKFAVNQTASQTKQYAWANTVYNDTGFDSVANTIRYPLANLWLPAGALITSVTGSIQVGDQWSLLRLNVEETTI